MDNKISIIDLFCGVGGLTNGFISEGMNVVCGYDLDKSCEYAYNANNKDAVFVHKDIRNIKASELIEKFKNAKYKILVGCAPCQQFSLLTSKKKKDFEKWGLLYQFSRLINETSPDVVSMENVPSLLSFKEADVFGEFKNNLKKQGYSLWYDVVYSPDYGIPQKRKRLLLLASKLGSIDLIPKTHKKSNYVKVRDVIKHLPTLRAGEQDSKDPIHRSRNLSDLNKKRIKSTKEGRSWIDWDDSLKLDCHKKNSGKNYKDVYGRMKWDDTAPTITTRCLGYGNGRFGHPEQNRAMSLREAAIFQTFPLTYKFSAGKNFPMESIARHIGNAVPPKLGQVLAKSIKKHIQEYEK